MNNDVQPIVLASEFATVAISRDDRGNGPRLLIRDLRSGRVMLLDPLELAALTWVRHEELAPFLDPSRFTGPGCANGTG
ncbi:MAG TPA: hypothetical protein VHY56_08410 [Candidatus Binataceae bacterium]|nr:hypothetical protein [Candidatus Binataceae bacterium]